MKLFPCLGRLPNDSQEQGSLISNRLPSFPVSFPGPALRQDTPFILHPAPFSGPSLTPLSPFCPHRTGDADDYHLAPLGGTAQLLCPLALWPVTVPTVVTWLRSPRRDGSQVVHVFRDGRDREEGVMPQYKGRTALLRDPREGSVSLEIRRVRLEDRGPYRCEVQIGNVTRQGTVTLQVAG